MGNETRREKSAEQPDLAAGASFSGVTCHKLETGPFGFGALFIDPYLLGVMGHIAIDLSLWV